MHEVALIYDLIKSLVIHADKNQIVRITKVRLVVGEAHGALPDALRFAFEVLSSGAIMGGAELEIGEDPVVCRCKGCNITFRWSLNACRCPACGNASGDIKGGRSLYIDYFEGDENDSEGIAG